MILTLENIHKGYGNQMLFRNLDLSIAQGEFITVVGRTGVGKSTLLGILGSFIKADEGRVLFQGKAVSKPDKERVIIFQTFDQLLPWRRVSENILFSLEQTRKEGFDIQEVIKALHLEGTQALYPHQLSGGMKQRVAMARALIAKPQVLLMDEPFGSLDPNTRSALQRELLRIWEEYRLTIIFVTHDVTEALLLGDRTLIVTDSGIEEIPNPLGRPRDKESINFRMFESEIVQYIK
ncbi:MAG: hypothetical protein AVO33_05270 [delta proteobacterium ML8_F1]|nr:MAG: hypothetical protein AVO33_05270 [delta proteobacterium ML8_F1]